MIYLINEMRHPESYFWNCLQSLASERQIQRILDGNTLNIGGVSYRIEFDSAERD